MTSDLAKIRSLLSRLPNELVEELLTEFQDLQRRFLIRDWGPGELNGGRFAEATLRVLEWMMSQKYTPIGKQLDRTKIINQVTNDTSLPEGHRFHVRRCTELLLDIRNKRDVAHLGPDIDVNRMDSELVLRLCAWILAETVRHVGQTDPDEAQTLIDKISAEQMPWIEEVDGDLIVLATELSAIDRTLLALHSSYPFPIQIDQLRFMVGYANSTQFKSKVLGSLGKDRRIHVKNCSASITRKGILEIESKMISLRNP